MSAVAGVVISLGGVWRLQRSRGIWFGIRAVGNAGIAETVCWIKAGTLIILSRCIVIAEYLATFIPHETLLITLCHLVYRVIYLRAFLLLSSSGMKLNNKYYGQENQALISEPQSDLD